MVFWPHCCTTCFSAAGCYRQSSVVCLSVYVSVTIVSPEKTAELINMLFWLWTQVGQRNRVLDGGPDNHATGQFCRLLR